MSSTQDENSSQPTAEDTREWLTSFADDLNVIAEEKDLPDEMKKHFVQLRQFVVNYAKSVKDDPKQAVPRVESQLRQYQEIITSSVKRIMAARDEYNAIQERSNALMQHTSTVVMQDMKEQAMQLQAKALGAEEAVAQAKKQYELLQRNKMAAMDAVIPGLSQVMSGTAEFAKNAPIPEQVAQAKEKEVSLQMQTLQRMRLALEKNHSLRNEKSKDSAEHLSSRERSSREWINKQIESDNKTGRFLKAMYSARMGWRRGGQGIKINTGNKLIDGLARKSGIIGKFVGAFGGIGGSIASDVHRSVRNWSLSGGWGKRLVGGALDLGMVGIKSSIDFAKKSRLGSNFIQIRKSEQKLEDLEKKLQQNLISQAEFKKAYDEHKRRLWIADEFRLNAETFGSHFLRNEYGNDLFKSKDDSRNAERADEYEALAKQFILTDEKGKKQYMRSLAGFKGYRGLGGIGKIVKLGRPKMAGGGVAISQTDVTVGDAGAEGIVPLEGKGAKMVGEAVANAILTGTHKESSTGGKMESAEARDARQQEEEDRHKIADNTSKIVEILDEDSKKKRDGDKDKKGLIGMLLAALGGLAASLLGKLSGLFASAGRMLAGLGGRILQPLAKFGSFLISSLKNVFRSLLSFFGIKLPEPPMPKPPVPTEPPVKPGEAKAKPGEAKPGEKPKAAESKPGEKPKPAEAKGKGKIARLKDALKKGGGVKNMFKMGVRGLAKGLGAGIATELLIEGITRGSAHLMGLTEEERQEARERREAMEVGHGHNDIYAGDLSDSEADDAEYEALKRTSDYMYRKRCKNLNVHHKTNQGVWFTESKDYRELTFDDIQKLGPRERKFFDEWLNSEEGKHKREVLQKQHPEAFGIKPTPQANPQAAAVQAKIAQMRERAKTAAKNGGVIPPTPEAAAAAAQMKGSNILPAAGAGLAAAGIAGAGLAGAGLAGAGLAAGAGLGKLALGAGGLAAAAAGMKAAIKDKDSGDQGPIDFENKILKDLKEINVNIDLIRKMVAMIKIDGTTLGSLVEGGSQTPGQAAAGTQANIYQGAAQAGGAQAGGAPAGGVPAGGMPTGGGVGDIVKKEESGSKGSMAIAYDGNGGTSYGTYQFATSKSSDSMSEFLQWAEKNGGQLGQNLARDMRAAGPLNTGSTHGAAVDVWKKYASSNPAEFARMEKGFMAQRAYNALNSKNFDPNLAKLIQSDRGLQEAWWSTVVQHGPGGARTVFKNAAAHCGGNLNPQNLISAVYDERAGVFRRGGQKKGDKLGKKTRGNVIDRFGREKQVVLGLAGQAGVNMLAIDGGGAAGGAPAPGSVPVSNPNGGPAPATQGPMAQLPMQQGAPVQGMPQMGGGAGYIDIARQWAATDLGYSQPLRDKEGHFDCSSLVYRSTKAAGVKWKVGLGSFTTAQMNPYDPSKESRNGQAMREAGFQWVQGTEGMKAGDVLWRKGHTVLYSGNGNIIGAHGRDHYEKIGRMQDSVSEKKLADSERVKYAGYWRYVGGEANIGGGMPAPAGQGAIPQSMEGAQQTQYGVGGTAQSGAQIQQSQAGMAQQAAIQGAGGGNVVDASMNVMGGGGEQGAQGPGVTFVTNKDPMGWVVLQGNCVH